MAGRAIVLLRIHLPGMYYVSKQEGGRYHHQKHPAGSLDARMLSHESLLSDCCPELVPVSEFLTWDGVLI